MLGPIIKPRYLLPPSLGLVAMSGVGLALAAHHLRRFRPQTLSLVAVFPVWLFLDGLAFMESFGRQRVEYAGAEIPDLPHLAPAFSARYADLPDPILLGLTARGMVNLRELLDGSPGGGAVPMLRDNRHTQAEMLAAIEERSFRVLDPRSCCEDADLGVCAERVVRELDQAGMSLFLPVRHPYGRRVKPQDEEWVENLLIAARDANADPDEETAWWWVRHAVGTGGEPPCSGGPSAIGGDSHRRAGDRGGLTP